MTLTWLWFRARTRGDAARLRLCLALSFGGAALGGALLGVVVRLPAWVGSGEGVRALLGGVVAYGALGGLVASFGELARLRGIPALGALDRLAPCLGVLVVLGRLGCFFAGCDFGRISSAPWAVRFPAGTPAFADHLARGLVLAGDPRSLPVHPTQIYEALLGVAVSAFALWTARSGEEKRPPGAWRKVIPAVDPPSDACRTPPFPARATTERRFAAIRGAIEREQRAAPGARGSVAACGPIERKRRAPGAVIWTATLTYAAGRLALDGLRGDTDTAAWGPWTASQWISVALLAWGAVALLWPRLRGAGQRP